LESGGSSNITVVPSGETDTAEIDTSEARSAERTTEDPEFTVLRTRSQRFSCCVQRAKTSVEPSAVQLGNWSNGPFVRVEVEPLRMSVMAMCESF
jgi:hypothetical protein